MTADGITAKQPANILYRTVEFNFGKLFKSLAKAGTHSATGNWVRLPNDLIELITSMKLKKADGGELAWVLIQASLLSSFQKLYGELSLVEDHDLGQLGELIDTEFQATELVLDTAFFDKPDQLPLLKKLVQPFTEWMIGAGISEPKAQTAASRIQEYFVVALHMEWQERLSFYEPLLEVLEGLKTPFSERKKQLRQWTAYEAWLAGQIHEPVFDETFSLSQIYVPLRAYCDLEEKVEAKTKRTSLDQDPSKRIVREYRPVEDWLTDWIEKADPNDAIRLISGGPGSGKSTFGKILAAQQASNPALRVLFVPLHRFRLEDDLEDALGQFCADNEWLPSLSGLKDEDRRWFLIFDGLDELGAIGRRADDIAAEFIKEVTDTLNRLNQDQCRAQILILGRDVAVDTHSRGLRRKTPRLHLLGFMPIPKETPPRISAIRGAEDLFKLDQRDEWWDRFGNLVGQTYPQGLPQDLKTQELDEITHQPLLNYILALSYLRGELDFSAKPTLNEIYEDLLSNVFEAPHRKNSGPASVRKVLNLESFTKILEEIALTTWHGVGRSATVDAIVARCKSSRLDRYLEAIQEKARDGVTRLLMAFYFREQSSDAGQQAFEFTHKSFGEYLVARRLVRLAFKSADWLKKNDQDPEEGMAEERILVHWAEICGPTRLDLYITRFINREFAIWDASKAEDCQKFLVRLLNHVLHQNMPMHLLPSLSTFKKKSEYSRNTQLALLICLSACASATRSVSILNWTDKRQPSRWFKELQISEESLLRYELVWPDLSGANLEGIRLEGAKLEGANLSGAYLGGANLSNTILKGANLRNVNISTACLFTANLADANLERAILQNTDIAGANLVGAKLKGADLDGANLGQCDLRGANLEKATLERANLHRVNLEDANLKETNLERANLEGANLGRANLEDTNLVGANLEGANLNGANLSGANLKGANLSEASLEQAILLGAILGLADLSGTNLVGANLGEANLGLANLAGAHLAGADLKGTKLKGTHLEDTIIEKWQTGDADE